MCVILIIIMDIIIVNIISLKKVTKTDAFKYAYNLKIIYHCRELAYTIANSYGNEVKEWLCRCLLRHRGLRGVDRSFCEVSNFDHTRE